MITKYFEGSGHILLVMDEREKKRIVTEYALTPQDQARIVTWAAAMDHAIEGLQASIIIDNVDAFLMQLFHKNPVLITFTGSCV